MLTHIVCWKYRADVDENRRDDHRRRLLALGGIIDEIQSIEVGSDVVGSDRSFDTVLLTRFADRDALDRYTVHPAHQQVVALGREIAEKAISVDFISESASGRANE